MSDVVAGPAIVEVTRGPLVDLVHTGTIAVVDVTGSLTAWAGEPSVKVAYWRSAAKPFQSMPLVYTGAAERFELEPADLAICCGSHNGEPEHVERVSRLLARVGCLPEDLACGVHPPLHAASAAALRRAGEEPSELHHNCSGLQAGMLLLARQLGAELEGYERPDHPVQREIVANVSRFTGRPEEEIVLGTDGCSVPTFGLSIRDMALGYARFMRPEGYLDEPFVSAATAIRLAMMKFPFLVGGTGRFDTDLMGAAGGRLVCKGGAGGVHCAATTEGLGFALKVDDGESPPGSSVRPKAVAALEALRQAGMFDHADAAVLRSHARPVVTTTRGDVVGEARPVLELQRPSSA